MKPTHEVYVLKHPVSYGDKPIEKVLIRRRTKVKDWRPMMDASTGELIRVSDFVDDKGHISQEGLMMLAPRLCDLMEEEFDEFDMEDGQAILAIIAGFLAAASTSRRGAGTGTTPLPSLPTDSPSPLQS